MGLAGKSEGYLGRPQVYRDERAEYNQVGAKGSPVQGDATERLRPHQIIDMTDKELQGVSQLVNELRGRLSPVLLSVIEEPPKYNVHLQTESELTNRIGELYRQVLVIKHTLMDTLRQVDL